MSAITNCILATCLLVIGIVAVTHILILLGRGDTVHQKYFRWAHRIAGYIFLVLYLFICGIMVKKLTRITTSLSAQDAIHAYLGITIFFLIIAKICIVKLYGKFYNRLPVYGMVAMLAVYLTVALNAGHYIIATLRNQYVFVSENGRLVKINVNVGRRVVQQKCSTCHSLERVYAYAKTEAGWRDYVSRMRAKDPVILNDAETLLALGYLIKNLGIDETKMDIQVGMKIVLEKCHKCHTVERVFTSKKTQAEWVKTIELMRSFDPNLLNDSEARQVNYYLDTVLARKEIGLDKLKTYRTSRIQDLLIR